VRKNGNQESESNALKVGRHADADLDLAATASLTVLFEVVLTAGQEAVRVVEAAPARRVLRCVQPCRGTRTKRKS
jgi:hypothetical protein